MTAKKKRPSRPNPVLKALQDANAHIEKLEHQLRDHQPKKATNQCGAEEARPVATAGGPNWPDALYPPACGPLQLVWSAGIYGSCVLGYQCDSFRVFESRQKAADWLRAQARRIEAWDEELTAAG